MMGLRIQYHCIKAWGHALPALALLMSTPIHAWAHEPQSGLSRQQWHAQLGWETQDCPLESPAAPETGIQVFELAPGLRSIQVQCQRLAYQATYFFYLQKGAQVTQQTFRQFESPDVGKLEPYNSPLVTGLPTMQPSAKALFILRKYRGHGDCGQYLEYRLNGRNWTLKQLRMNECAETFPAKVTPPQKWPVRKKP